jgi:hypothetical protein
LPSLDSPRLKIERANEHLRCLDDEFRAFERQEPYELFREAHPDGPFDEIRLKVHADPPTRLGLLVGDVIQNLRAALDHLVWELSLLTTDEPWDKSQFPIFDVDKGKAVTSSIRDVPSDAQDVIKALQPYNRPDPHADPLWPIYRLSNLDKHRSLVPIGYSVTAFTILKGATEAGFVRISGMFQDGDVVNAIPRLFPPLDQHVHFEERASYSIVFEEGGPSGVIDLAAIHVLHEYVRDEVIPRFAGFFPK